MTLDQTIKHELSQWKTITRQYVKPDKKRAIIQLLNTFIPFLGMWVLMYLSLEWSYWITLGIGLVNGLFLVRIFVIQHDCGHQSFLKSTRWNNIIGIFCSVFTSIPYRYWASVHGFHHTHSGQLEVRDVGDIDFLTVEEYEKLSPRKRFGYQVVRFPIMLFFFAPLGYLLVSNRFPLRFKDNKAIFTAQVLNNLFILACYIGLAFLLGWKEFLIIQIPLLLVFTSVAFWFFYVQHQHEEAYKHWEKDWDYLLSAIRGSTYYKLPRVMNWLSANIGYHHIHHLNCGIPNYNLARCAEENPILQKYVTVLSFKESLKCAQNKLWYEKEERMITFEEYRKLKMA